MLKIYNLYEDAKWSAYTSDMDKLMRAIKNSDYVFTAWDNEILIGLIRGISDKETVLFIQDILILGSYKRLGIGTQLIEMILRECQVRQTILQTDLVDEISNVFYLSLGFSKSEDIKTQSYVLYRHH